MVGATMYNVQWEPQNNSFMLAPLKYRWFISIRPLQKYQDQEFLWFYFEWIISILVERIDVILASQRVSVLTLLSMGKATWMVGWMRESCYKIVNGIITCAFATFRIAKPIENLFQDNPFMLWRGWVHKYGSPALCPLIDVIIILWWCKLNNIKIDKVVQSVLGIFANLETPVYSLLVAQILSQYN